MSSRDCHLSVNFSCLCPPSSYGSQCEFPNHHRVSLTVEVHAGFDWPIAFRFLLMLMDNEGSVESFEQLDLIWLRESFNVCGNCATIIQHEDGFIAHLKEISKFHLSRVSQDVLSNTFSESSDKDYIAFLG
jgi:hypothetical protein